jgi:protein-disulfide isomerase
MKHWYHAIPTVARRAIGLTTAAALLAACAPAEHDTSDGEVSAVASAADSANMSAAPTRAATPVATTQAARSAPATAIATPKPIAPAAPRDSVAPSPAPAIAQDPERSPRGVVVRGVDLTGVGYDRGSATAPVVVVNFSDFGCPYCGSFARETEPVLEREYVRTGKVFFKYVPFVMGMFPNGQQAARASECSAEQGKFWAMHDLLYAKQAEWKRSISPYRVFQGYAPTLGLDVARFSKCYAGQEVHARTRRANEAAEALGVRVTPSFVVNGQGVEGALPIAEFRRLLDAAIGEAK